MISVFLVSNFGPKRTIYKPAVEIGDISASKYKPLSDNLGSSLNYVKKKKKKHNPTS